MSREGVNGKAELALLSDFYGGLLTDHQRRILSLYCEEDYSLGEIAEEAGISRQAAHETITRASSRLRELEAALGDAKKAGTLVMIEACCALGARADLGRPTTTAEENKKSFMETLKLI